MQKRKNDERRRWRFIILIGLFALLGVLYLVGFAFYRQSVWELDATAIQQTDANSDLVKMAHYEFAASAVAGETVDVEATIVSIVARYMTQTHVAETRSVITPTPQP